MSVELSPDEETVTRTFRVVSSDYEKVPDNWKHIIGFIVAPVVWHLYEVINDR